MTAPEIAPALARNVADVHGAAGRAWLARLPATLDAAAIRWDLRFERPLPAAYAYVVGVRTPGGEAILKAAVPGGEADTERLALGHHAGRGIVRLLDADPGRGLLLLERLRPGRALVTERDDERATRVAAEVIGRLHGPDAGRPEIPPAFPSTGDWALGFARHREAHGGGAGPLPEPLFATAERLSRELHASAGSSVLLHGDLHHRNILSGGASWVAIDPKGVTGEAAYECGALLRNPAPEVLEWRDLERVLARRVAILSEMTGHARERVAGWGVAQGVLSAVWSVEDHGAGWEVAVRCAELLAAHVR